MSHVHRLRTSDRIFFVTVNLLRRVRFFDPSEYPIMLAGGDDIAVYGVAPNSPPIMNTRRRPRQLGRD